MKQLWVDPFSGLSGDLWVGGFLALGVPEAELVNVLRSLPFSDLGLKVETAMRCGIQGTKASVVIGGAVDAGGTPHLILEPGQKKAVFRRKEVQRMSLDPRQRTRWRGTVHGHFWKDVDVLLAKHLPGRMADYARETFHRLGLAEARVHGLSLDQVHFHEVGLKDSIADVALAVAGWVLLGEPEVHIGPIALGKGSTRMAHGIFPIPAPAALFLLEGFETVPGVAPMGKELCTPTGAALAATLAVHRRAPQRFIPARSGFACGGWDFPNSPNVCRFTLGEVPPESSQLVQLETNLDDATPQQVAYAQTRLLEAGALDVWVTSATFKKGRSGWVLAMLLEPSKRDALAAILTEELPTLGFRLWPVQRLEAERSFVQVDVEGHAVPVKEGKWPEQTIRQPEFEDARRAAQATGLALREVQKRARGKG